MLLKFRFKIWNLRFWDAFAGCKSLFTDWIRFINCNFTLQFAKLILHLHIEFENRNRLMEEYNVAIRLKGFIESQGLTNSQFADRCGIPRPSLSQLLTGRNKKSATYWSARFITPFRSCRFSGLCLAREICW